jgi:hypothetical protein
VEQDLSLENCNLLFAHLACCLGCVCQRHFGKTDAEVLGKEMYEELGVPDASPQPVMPRPTRKGSSGRRLQSNRGIERRVPHSSTGGSHIATPQYDAL